MRTRLARSLLAITLFIVAAQPSYALGGHQFHGHGVIELRPSGAPSHIFVPPRGGMRSHRFVRRPFFAWGPWGGWTEPDEAVVVPQFAVAVPSETPVPDPKFVFPPTPSTSVQAGTQTVIVQRGSQIEVQSFPNPPRKSPTGSLR
jgi:hypothetical protein